MYGEWLWDASSHHRHRTNVIKSERQTTPHQSPFWLEATLFAALAGECQRQSLVGYHRAVQVRANATQILGLALNADHPSVARTTGGIARTRWST